MKSSFFLASALLALLATCSAAAAAGASESSSTSPVVPVVDPELSWLTPQEFKVKRGGEFGSPTPSMATFLSFCASERARSCSTPATNSSSWALLDMKGRLFWEQTTGPKEQGQGTKKAQSCAFLSERRRHRCWASFLDLDLLLFFFFFSPPPSSSSYHHHHPTPNPNRRSSTSRRTPSRSCTSSPAPAAPPATP